MKTTFAFLVLVTTMCLIAFAQNTSNSAPRVSVAEIGAVKLEVAQFPNLQNGIRIHVRDYAAQNWQKEEVSCSLYEISDDGKEGKKPFMSVVLKATSPNSDDYSGGATNRVEFEHGNKFKVVYMSYGLPLPISTWYACYYQ